MVAEGQKRTENARGTHGPNDEIVIATLDAIRRRRILVRLIELSTWLAWTLAALALLLYLLRSAAWSVDGWYLIAAAIAIVGWTVAALFRFARRPESRARAADHVDRALALEQRATSAIEVLTAHTEPGPFRDAIVSQASDRLRSADARRLVTIRIPVSMLVALALCVAALFAPDVPLAGPDNQASSTATQSPGDLLEDIRALEQEVGSRTTNDRPYVSAVHAALNDLGDQLESGDISAIQAASEYDRLVEHARASFAEEGLSDPVAAAREGSLPSYLRTTPGSQFVAPEDARPTAVSDPPERGHRTVAEAPGRSSGERDASAEATIEEGAFGTGRQGDLESMGTTSGENFGSPPTVSTSDNPVDAAGHAIGGAEQSSAGASSLAGRGTQPLEGRAETLELDPVRENVALPSTDRADGRNIRIEVVPESSSRETLAASGSTGDWRTTTESIVPSEPLRYAAIQVVSRFFAPEESQP